jgi:hypothetical protein
MLPGIEIAKKNGVTLPHPETGGVDAVVHQRCRLVMQARRRAMLVAGSPLSLHDLLLQALCQLFVFRSKGLPALVLLER